MSVHAVKYKSLIKIHNFDLFIECCKRRYQYDEGEATSLQWQELAAEFQRAKGASYSYMAEYCLMRARNV